MSDGWKIVLINIAFFALMAFVAHCEKKAKRKKEDKAYNDYKNIIKNATRSN